MSLSVGMLNKIHNVFSKCLFNNIRVQEIVYLFQSYRVNLFQSSYCTFLKCCSPLKIIKCPDILCLSYNPVLVHVFALNVVATLGQGISCYTGRDTNPTSYFLAGYSFSNYSCVKYCFTCTKDDKGCTASQRNSSTVLPAYTFVMDETALVMTNAPDVYMDAVACKTRNCNAPPHQCTGIHF